MTPLKQYYENAASTIIKNLAKRQMEGYYCESSEKAVEKVLSLMPEGSSIGWGGSVTLSEIGLLETIKRKDYIIYDRSSAESKEEQKKIYTQIFGSDFFLMSTNAITLDGELVNIDNTGNRVASLCYGPENVIVVAGMNKVVSDVASGIKRVQDIASSANTVRLKRKTPCAMTGRCGDCFSPESICAQVVVTRLSRGPGRIKVVLVGEVLGY